MILSVVVPIYNKAEYLPALFTSLMNQGLEASDFEILLVDDGSSDKSGELCREFVERHKDYNIRYIFQQNAGVSAARNTGIENAKADFIHFMDSDDSLHRLSYSKIADAINAAYDYIGFGITLIDSRTHDTSDRSEIIIDEGYIEKTTCGIDLIKNTAWPSSSVAGLYRRRFLNDQNIRFPLGISIGEDVWFNFEFFSKNPTCALTNFRPYIYWQRPGSAITSISKESGERWFHSYYHLLNHLSLACKKYPEFESGIVRVINHHVEVFIPKALQAGLERNVFKYWGNRLKDSNLPMGGYLTKCFSIICNYPILYPPLSFIYRKTFLPLYHFIKFH